MGRRRGFHFSYGATFIFAVGVFKYAGIIWVVKRK